MSVRIERISEQVRGEVARVLREESHDPRIGMLSITRVKVSPDLSTALIFWSPLDIDGETDLEDVAEGLASATGFVRRQLAQNLNLRRTPALDFKYDPSLEQGSRTLALLRSLPENSAGGDQQPGPEGDGQGDRQDEEREEGQSEG